MQYLNVDAIIDAAIGRAGGETTMVVEIPFDPGGFVSAGLPVVWVWPAQKLGSEAEDAMHDAFYFGEERSFRQDFAFGL